MSKKKIALLVGAALIVGVVALGGGAAYVFARGSIASGDGPPIPLFGRGGRHGMRGFADGDAGPMAMIDAAAEAVGMTPEEVFSELREGKTPQEILEEHDLDWTTLHEEMQESMHEDGIGFHHGGFGMLGFGDEDCNPIDMFNAAAEAAGMTPEELFAELQAGKTIREIMEEHDVDWTALYESMHEDGDGFLHGGFGVMGFGPGDGNMIDMFNAAAEAVGMTPEELFAELQAGKTIQELLEEHDVDWTALREDMQELMPGGGFGHPGRGRKSGRMGGFGGLAGDPMALLDAAAEELGMTSEELQFELQEGKSPREIVEEQGLDPEQFFGELGQTFIAQAVGDGKLTQEQADWLLKGLEQGYFPMPMYHGEDGHWGPCGSEETPDSSE